MPQHAHFSIHRSSSVAKLHFKSCAVCFQIYQRPFGTCVETHCDMTLETQTPRDDVQKSWLQQLLCGVCGKGDLFRKTSPESNSAGWKRWKLKEKISNAWDLGLEKPSWKDKTGRKNFNFYFEHGVSCSGTSTGQ